MDKTPFLKNNLAAMVASASAAGKWLATVKPDPVKAISRIVINPRVGLDWRIDDSRTLYSGMHPDLAYSSWVSQDKQEKAKTSCSFIVGTGLGYGINKVLSALPAAHKVYVIEPDPELLLACLGQTDYVPFIESGRLVFLPPVKEVIEHHVQQCDVQFLFGKIYLRLDTPCQQLSPAYSHWGRVCREMFESFSVELATLRRRQDVMVGNELDNFRRAMADGSVERLKGAARGLPAVILGAGPSLAAMAPALAANPGQALYTTALQTLPAVYKAGITPHLCMGIDFNKEMEAVFHRLDREWAANIPLIYSTKMHPDVVAAYPGPTLPIWTMGGMASFVRRDQEMILDAAGNVSVALARVLAWCGVERIVLAGQDFAFRAGKTHAEGHHNHYRMVEIDPKKHIPLKDADNETIYSTMTYMAALRDMEQDITKSQVPYYNLYGGGAVIKGAMPVTLESAREQGLLDAAPERPLALDEFLETIELARNRRPWPRFESRAAQWATSLRHVTKRLDRLFKHTERDQNQMDIHGTFKQARSFLKQDPLYLPYLYNEVQDLRGLVHAGRRYTLRDLSTFRDVTRRALAKVRRIDSVMAPPAPSKCGSKPAKARNAA